MGKKIETIHKVTRVVLFVYIFVYLFLKDSIAKENYDTLGIIGIALVTVVVLTSIYLWRIKRTN